MVTYWLKKPEGEYKCLWTLLQSAPSWWHYLESTWIIRTDESVEAWLDKIRKVMDSKDFIMVIDITGKPIQGWLPEDAWKWINEQTLGGKMSKSPEEIFEELVREYMKAENLSRPDAIKKARKTAFLAYLSTVDETDRTEAMEAIQKVEPDLFNELQK